MTSVLSIDGTKRSRKEGTDALGALMFITPKRDVTVKARIYIDKREASMVK